MATISERLAYVLTFDTSSGVRSLDQLGKAADKNLKNVDQRLDRAAVSMQKWGAAAVAFAGVAGAGLYKLASGAADAEANMSALEQVVGEAVAQDIGKWAEDSAKGVGMASKDAVAAATTFAQLGKIIGLGGDSLATFSTDLTGLSADFAAFKNVAPEQALQDIQSAFAGSTEVMRKYGIFLDDATLKSAYFRETGEEVTGTLTAQQKIVAINSELYRQGADMIGQWGRESSELAGQQAILKAELTNLGDAIGAGVLPHVVSLMGGLTSMVSLFSSIDRATAGAAGSIAAVGVAILALGGGTLYAAGKLLQFRDGVRAMIAQTPRLAAGLGVVSAAMILYSIDAKKAADVSRDAADSLDDLGRASNDELLRRFIASLHLWQFAGEDAAGAIEEIARTTPGAIARMLDMEDASGALTAELTASGMSASEAAAFIDDLRAALDAEAVAQANAAETRDRGTEAMQASTVETWGSVAATKAAERAAELGAAATEKMQAASEDAAEAHANLTSELQDLQDKIEELTEAQGDLVGAEVDLERSTLNYQDAMISARMVIDSTESSERDRTEAVPDAKDAIRDQADALADHEIATREANGEVLTASEKNAILAEPYRDLADDAIP